MDHVSLSLVTSFQKDFQDIVIKWKSRCVVAGGIADKEEVHGIFFKTRLVIMKPEPTWNDANVELAGKYYRLPGNLVATRRVNLRKFVSLFL